jgi:hypothetical protein
MIMWEPYSSDGKLSHPPPLGGCSGLSITTPNCLKRGDIEEIFRTYDFPPDKITSISFFYSTFADDFFEDFADIGFSGLTDLLFVSTTLSPDHITAILHACRRFSHLSTLYMMNNHLTSSLSFLRILRYVRDYGVKKLWFSNPLSCYGVETTFGSDFREFIQEGKPFQLTHLSLKIGPCEGDLVDIPRILECCPHLIELEWTSERYSRQLMVDAMATSGMALRLLNVHYDMPFLEALGKVPRIQASIEYIRVDRTRVLNADQLTALFQLLRTSFRHVHILSIGKVEGLSKKKPMDKIFRLVDTHPRLRKITGILLHTHLGKYIETWQRVKPLRTSLFYMAWRKLLPSDLLRMVCGYLTVSM